MPLNVFYFQQDDVFEETATDNQDYPIQQGQELLLVNGSNDPVCSSVAPFAEEGDAPILGLLPDGEWLLWTPQIMFEDNGPSINDNGADLSSKVLQDGGGAAVVATNEKLMCSNVQRSFINEDSEYMFVGHLCISKGFLPLKSCLSLFAYVTHSLLLEY